MILKRPEIAFHGDGVTAIENYARFHLAGLRHDQDYHSWLVRGIMSVLLAPEKKVLFLTCGSLKF